MAATDFEERVALAAEALVASGRTPLSIRNVDVQAATGGSFRDIAPALRRWKDLAERAGSRAGREPLPENLAQALTRLGQTFWSEVSAVAQEKIAAAQASAREEVAEAHTAADEVVETLKAMQVERDRQAAEMAALQTELAQLRDQTLTLTAAAARAEERASAAGAEVTRTQEELAATRTRLEEAQRAEMAARIEAAEWKGRAERGN